MKVGHKLKSCTVDVLPSPVFRLGGRQVCLIDTPGFDDSNIEVSDTVILQKIADHLAAVYQGGRKLSGLIYFHRILDNRVGGVNAKSMKMFRLLCGRDALKNVVLCTTMWDMLPHPGMGEERETELKSDFWEFMLEEGASTARHDGSAQSARDIVSRMLGLDPVELKIQQELVDDKKKLNETEAGVAVDLDLQKLRVMYERRLEESAEAMKEALAENDRTMQRMITKECARYEAKIQQMEQDLETLNAERQKEIDVLTAKVKKLEEGKGCIIC